MVVSYFILNCLPALIFQFLFNVVFLIYREIFKKKNEIKVYNLIIINFIIGLFIINVFPIVIGGISDNSYPFQNTLFNLSLIFKTLNIAILITEIFLFWGITIFFLKKSYSVKLIIIINILISFIMEAVRFLSRYNPSNLIYIVVAILTSIITIMIYKVIKK